MSGGNMWTTLVPLVVLLLVMYFLLIRPQKKREKQVNEMRSNVRVGDEIITIGGICGKVVKTKEESLVIQVGADKVKFEVMRWSVSKVVENAKPTKKVSVPASSGDEDDEPKKAMPKRLKKKTDTDKDAEQEEPAKEETAEAEPKAEEPASEPEAAEVSTEETPAEPAEEEK